MSSNSISPRYLTQALFAVHFLLESNNLNHVFLGGFQLLLMGSDRQTKDIDVEVEKPFYHGFEKVQDAFKTHPDFIVFEGSRKDGIRAVWNKTVGVDILMRPGRLPKTYYPINVGPNPQTGVPLPLPFLSPTHLTIEKIRCAGERSKPVDLEDIQFIYSVLCVRDRLVDFPKVRRSLNREDIDEALKNHPHLAPILQVIMAS